ncbi:hypothetical protein QX201_007492 [Fusarium graminearum]
MDTESSTPVARLGEFAGADFLGLPHDAESVALSCRRADESQSGKEESRAELHVDGIRTISLCWSMYERDDG